MDKNFFNKYFKKLTIESVLKSLLFAVLISSGLCFIASIICWVFGEGFVIPLIVFVCSTVISFLLFYFLLYKQDLKKVAARIDELGLEERVITMVELENDNSPIAKLQREDTLNAIKNVNESSIKLKLKKWFLIITIIALVLGTSMTTVASLASKGVLLTGEQLWAKITYKEPTYYDLFYKVEGNGSISENDSQRINLQTDGKPVLATIDDDWVFVEWVFSVKGNPFTTSEIEGPFRQDSGLTKDVIVSAILEKLQYEQAEGDTKDDQIGSSNCPYDPEQSSGDGESKKSRPSKDRPDYGSNNSQTVKYDIANQVYDGKQYYGDFYEQFFQDAMNELSGESNIPSEIRKLIEDYYKRIEK